MTDQQQFEEQVNRYASFVEKNDYGALSGLLDLACMYEDGSMIVGRDNVIDLFHAADEWVKQNFDSIEQECTPRWREDHWIMEITSRAECRGESCAHKCEQRLEFTPEGLVEFIQYIFLPGEVEKLSRFMTRVGIEHQQPETSDPD